MNAAVAMAWRSTTGVLRQPQLLVPGIFFPLFFVGLNTASMGRAPMFLQGQGFPAVDSMLDFLTATVVIQGVLFGAISSGTDLARDIETGFFDRLVSAPVSRLSILVGRLAGAAVFGMMQAIVFVSVMLACGARIKGGFPAVVVLGLMGFFLAMAIGGFAQTMALRTGSAEAVQGAFPIFFILLFTSSMFFPREVMSGWYQDLASANPMSYLVEAARRLVINQFAWSDAAMVIGICVAILAVSMTLATLALAARLRGPS